MTRLLAAVLFFATMAQASPALHGTWSAAVDGQPLVVTFDANGGGKVNGTPMQWQALGRLLFIQQQGQQAVSYSFQVQDGKLTVGGGDLSSIVVLTPGTKAADAAKAKQPKTATAAAAASSASGNGQELVGKWCLMSTFTANAGGGSQRSTCFELRPDGTYTYRHEGSMSANAPGMWGGTSSQSSDAGRWQVKGNQLVAQSQRGTTSSYTLEKRNHPKNKRDPMICLNGECYVTFYNKPAW
jgi:hypothetical protein